jgi:hypothetical protein
VANDVHTGDTIYGNVYVQNNGPSVETNLEALVWAEGSGSVSPSSFVLNIGDLNPGEAKGFPFEVKSTGTEDDMA